MDTDFWDENFRIKVQNFIQKEKKWLEQFTVTYRWTWLTRYTWVMKTMNMRVWSQWKIIAEYIFFLFLFHYSFKLEQFEDRVIANLSYEYKIYSKALAG